MKKADLPASGPLHCWDIYMETYFKMVRRGEDLQQLKLLSQEQDWRPSLWNLEQKLIQQRSVVLVTDPTQVIRFATHNLVEMNGYEPYEVIGKSPKMFQGAETEKEKRAAIRKAVQQCVPFETTILNYRKDGSLYHCHVEEYPVWNTRGKLVNFIAFEKVA